MPNMATPVCVQVTVLQPFYERVHSFSFHENLLHEVDLIFMGLFHAATAGGHVRRTRIKSPDADN